MPKSNPIDNTELEGFVKQILSTLNIVEANIVVLDGLTAKERLSSLGIMVNKEMVVEVDAKGIGEHGNKLSKFLCRDVFVINPDKVYWQEGDNIDVSTESFLVAKDLEILSENADKQKNSVSFHKNKTRLPHWLDLVLFKKFGAVYSPEYNRYEYNLDLNEQEVKVYLGTYFPRSYAEAFCVFDDLLSNHNYLNILNGKPQINILDYGCGTGGELIGLLVALSKYLNTTKEINVTVVDGNSNALNSLREIASELKSRTHHNISLACIEKTIETEEDLENMIGDSLYHFVLNSKMVCELISKKVIADNAYSKVADVLTSLMAEDGILYMLDVTTMDSNLRQFYPRLMNQELNEYLSNNKSFATLLPLACSSWYSCKEACFIQQTFCVSHSQKHNDESRVCYRLICRQNFKDKVFSENASLKDCKHIIYPTKFEQNDLSAFCAKSINGTNIIDTYNINK